MTQPAIYLPHGGGPWPWIDEWRETAAALRVFLEGLPQKLAKPPKAVVCVTAHWEAAQCTVSAASRPGMLYDYGGFPAHTYEVTWPAPGAVDVAARIRSLLDEAGINNAEDGQRGYDHGTFVPLAVAWPEADIPVVQMSLVQGLDPVDHLAIGRALRPIRDEGVLLLGSGMSYHSFPGMGAMMQGQGGHWLDEAMAFDGWLAETMPNPNGRERALEQWLDAPSARACHPREEHLLPLMVMAGAATGEGGQITFRDRIMGTPVSAVQFG